MHIDEWGSACAVYAQTNGISSGSLPGAIPAGRLHDGLSVLYRLLLTLASLGAWGRTLFFVLGFPDTGPYVVAIYEMLRKDVGRFGMLMIVLLMGYTQASFSLHDPEAGGGGALFLQRLYKAFRIVL